jgi:hypothetical protein
VTQKKRAIPAPAVKHKPASGAASGDPSAIIAKSSHACLRHLSKRPRPGAVEIIINVLFIDRRLATPVSRRRHQNRNPQQRQQRGEPAMADGRRYNRGNGEAAAVANRYK